MDWTENEDGPDCECGNPTVVKKAGDKFVLLCLFHTSAEGMYQELPNTKPDDWDERVAQNAIG